MGDYDAICIGDAKLDAFLTLADANSKVRLDEKTKELCVHYGEKISVEHTYFSVGGNAANVTIGLARLGIKTTIAAETGDDEFSLKIVNTFAKENIDRGFLKQKHRQESSFSVAINFKGDRTLFTEHVTRDHDFSYEDAHTKWIYLTSLGEEWTGAYQKAIDYTQKNKTRLAFNPGTGQLAKKSSVVAEALRVTDILFVNKEEAALLISEYAKEKPSENVHEMLISVQKLGPKIVVITDGSHGSYCLDSEKHYYHQANFPCTIIERTGAGDAYSTGFLAATIHGKTIQEAMLWASIDAASVIGKIGAEAGLLKKEEMEKQLHESR